MILDREITVCDNCLRASCWQGIFMCEKSRNAGTIEKTVGELHDLSLENPEYWFKSPHTGAIDQHGLGAYLQETGKRERDAAKGGNAT